MQEHPQQKHPQPPMPEQQQKMPGITAKMDPKPDHGERSYRGSGKLTDRVALITGADSGIGRAVAIAFAREGADVLISYLEEDEDANETARWVKEAGRKAIMARGDISDEVFARSLVKRAMDECGRLDILVNNAAHQATFEHLEDISSAEWDLTFRTNIYPIFHLCQEAVKVMKLLLPPNDRTRSGLGLIRDELAG